MAQGKEIIMIKNIFKQKGKILLKKLRYYYNFGTN
jgi:hypothetical protein